VVDPERLFKNYPYRSGASPVFREHLRQYAEEVMDRFGVPRFVVEIGSNDGTFLKHFRDRRSDVLGVDPADIEVDFPRIMQPFSRSIANIIHESKSFFSWPSSISVTRPDLIVANHVFAHADDLKDIAIGVRELLSDDGVFVFEIGYLVDVFEKTIFDVIYHEHLSYHHLRPLIPFLDRCGLTLFDAKRVDTQGGSIRCFVKKNLRQDIDLSAEASLLLVHEGEIGLAAPDVNTTIAMMWDRIETTKRDLLEYLRELKSEGAHIAGYGAPAKCCTLMHTLGFGPDVLDFIVDDSPVKHGCFTPGKHVEIRPVETLYVERVPVDYVLVLAWNFAESIMAAHPGFKFIVPLPKVETILPGRQVAL
jgi:SAM-dependent methyltransferase